MTNPSDYIPYRNCLAYIKLKTEAVPYHSGGNKEKQDFLENEIVLKVSTISIAEYCVRGKIDELPLRNIQIIPFNLDHAIRTGEFAEAIFTENKIGKDKLSPRAIIPNDSKLFAQADLDKTITYFITSDSRSKNTFSALKKRINPK